MKITALRLLCCALFAIVISATSWAQTQIGQIKAARVEGQVLRQVADGTSAPIKNGDMLTESDVITTGKGGSVVLVFMNGASVKVGSESRLAIEQFKMDPLAEEINPATLKAEPSVSQTTLKLSYGEVVGDVKTLNKSSSYTVKTAVGAAGIRGTIFRIVFRPAADGKAYFTVQTAEGHVVMEGVTNVDIPIEAGKEVVVEVDVPPPGTPPAPPVVVTQDIPTETKTLITAATQNIAEAAQQTVFTPQPAETSAPKEEEKKEEEKKEEKKEEEKKIEKEEPDNPAAAVKPDPVLTIGDGKT